MQSSPADLKRFYDNYHKALRRWHKACSPATTDKLLEGCELSRITRSGLPTSSLIAYPDKAELSFVIYEGTHRQEIWRDCYEELQELERAWLSLSFEELQEKHLVELEAFFSDLDE